jgi:hypothetical protein
MKIEGLPVIDVDESEKITVAVRTDDLLEGDTANPDRHPIAIALRRQFDDARDEERDASPPWQEVVPLRCPGQAIIQAAAKDIDDVAGLITRVQKPHSDKVRSCDVLQSFDLDQRCFIDRTLF